MRGKRGRHVGKTHGRERGGKWNPKCDIGSETFPTATFAVTTTRPQSTFLSVAFPSRLESWSQEAAEFTSVLRVQEVGREFPPPLTGGEIPGQVPHWLDCVSTAALRISVSLLTSHGPVWTTYSFLLFPHLLNEDNNMSLLSELVMTK